MKARILLVPFISLMILMVTNADQSALDSIYELESLFVQQQYQFLPISPPADAVYVHTSETVLPVDWATFPKEFISQMYAEMDANGYPLYRVSVYEDAVTRETVFLNSYDQEAYRLAAEIDYDPYAWQKVQFDLEAGEVLSELWQWIFDPAHIAAEFILLPEVFHADYLADQQSAILLQSASLPMMMSLSLPTTNLLMAINHTTNGVVELEIGWPSTFTNRLEIFASTNLVTRDWELIHTNITTAGTNNYVWPDDASTNFSQRFYITGNADLDSDLDYLADAREYLLYSTDPEEEDTDGDGLWDGNEVYGDGTHGDGDGFITDPLVQDTGYLLPILLYTSPATNLSGFSAFNPPTTNMAPNANTPAISEWTRTAGPGDTIALAAMGSPTNYIAYAPGLLHTSGTTNWFSGGHGAVTLPDTLPADEMILLWPVNTNGAGPAIALNKTEVWWNQTQAATGEVFSIFGRNLGTNCHVWVEEEDEWLDSISCNPYKADFLVPTNYSNGSYTLWAHNGSGHQYGFADSLSMDVISVLPWDETFTNWFDVTTYGATGNGVTDDWPAIEAAIDDADDTPWSTVYFPEGHYRIGSKLDFSGKDEIRIVGEDMEGVVIQPHDNYTNIPPSTVWAKYIIQSRLTDFELKKVTLRSYGEFGKILIRTEHDSRNVILDEVVLDQTPADISYSSYQLSGDRTANFVTSTNITLRNSVFLQKVNIFAETRCSQIFVDNCTFVGMNDAAHLFGISGSEQVSIINSTAENLDDTAAESNTNAWSQGRWVHSNGGFQNIYFGGNKTVNMMVREGYTENQNTGEQFMFELMKTHYHGMVTTATSNTVTFNAALPAINLVGMVAVVQEGDGQGQNRLVTGMTTNMITLDEPWLVEPDVGSAILVGTFSRRIAIHGNSFDGRSRALGSSFMGCAGIESYGGCVDLVAEGNHFTEMRFPINVQSKFTAGVSGPITQPNFFNLFMNNTGSNCYHALTMYVDKMNGVPYYTPQLLGNVYRNNAFDTLSDSPLLYHGAFTGGIVEQIDMQILDKNSFTNYTSSLILYDKIEETNVINQVTINP